MHRNYHPRLVACTHVDSVASALTPKHEAQFQGDTNEVLCGGSRKLRRHTGISIGLIRMSSVGIGRPSSTRDSIYSSMASRMFSTPSSMVSLCVWHPGKVGQKT